MNIQRVISLMCFHLILLPITYGQSSDPYAIFDSAVEVRIVESTPLSSTIDYDDQLRLLLFDKQVLAYPDEVTRVFDFVQIEGRFILQVQLDTHSQYQSSTWEYDVETRQFSEFEPYCSTIRYSPSSLTEQPWTIAQIDNQWVLCNIFDGEQSPPLPEGYDWIVDTFGREPDPQVSLSPDNPIIAFMGTQEGVLQSNSARYVDLFSYQQETQEVLELGQFLAQDSLYFSQWVDTQVLFYTGTTTSVGSMCVLIADTVEVDTIYGTLCSNRGFPTLLDNPPRLTLSYETGALLCGYETYYIENNETTRIELGGLCHPEYGDIEAVGYYRDVQ